MDPRERASLNPYSLPEYVDRASDPVWDPPYEAQDVNVFGFLLEANQRALDRLLQRDLVVPSHGAVDYRSASPHVVVLCADIGRLSSADPHESKWGFMTENEVGIWCLAADVRDCQRLVWYLPYLYTDTGATVTTGREVYGYPKQLGTFEDDFPKRMERGGVTTVTASAIARYGRDQCKEELPMVSVRAFEPLAPGDGCEDLDKVAEVLRGKLQLSRDVPSGPPPDQTSAITADDADAPPRPAAIAHWIRRVLDTLEGGLEIVDDGILLADMFANPTLVFLKQFRDVRCREKACYQAVTEVQFRVLPLFVELLDATNFEVTLQSWDSQPLADDVGVRPGVPTQPVAAFRASMRFEIGFGYEVWRAPT